MNELTESDSQLPAPISARIAKLRAQSSLSVELWQPEPNESLIGELIGSKKAVGTYGENYQILIRDETGKVTAAWLTQWLKENLRAQSAEQGDLVAITFLGKRQSPAGRFYNAYSLIVDKTT